MGKTLLHWREQSPDLAALLGQLKVGRNLVLSNVFQLGHDFYPVPA